MHFAALSGRVDHGTQNREEVVGGYLNARLLRNIVMVQNLPDQFAEGDVVFRQLLGDSGAVFLEVERARKHGTTQLLRGLRRQSGSSMPADRLAGRAHL
jgi:hypothetical protein